jgi:hypothetical protein
MTETGYSPHRPFRRRVNRRLKTIHARGRAVVTRLKGGRVVHILHIGKTGGNAIRNGLGIRKGRPAAFPKGLVIQHPHDTTLPMCPVGDSVAFVVRDPVHRFVSGFWHRFRKGREGLDPWSEGEARAFARFTSPDALGRALGDADPEVRGAAEDAMRTIGHVRNTLTRYLVSPEYLRARRADILDIGFMERLPEHFQTLSQALDARDVPGLPDDTHFANRTPDSFPRELSEDAIANLRSWYAEDLRIYAACRELAGLPDAADRDTAA